MYFKEVINIGFEVEHRRQNLYKVLSTKVKILSAFKRIVSCEFDILPCLQFYIVALQLSKVTVCRLFNTGELVFF